MVLLLGLIGFLTIGSLTTLVLNAPAVLKAGTGLSPGAIGVIVSAGGLIGAASMLTGGWFSDRAGDRLRDSGVLSAVMAAGFLGLALSGSPVVTVVAYLVFCVACFTVPMLTSAAWADVLHVRQLAVGAAVINTVSQLGAFATPYAWGAMKDATGSFRAGLFGLTVMAIALAALQIGVRNAIRSRRGRSKS